MNTSSRGFTLIELMVVIAIIGLLSSVVLTSLNSARAKAQDTTVKRNLATVRHQAALYLSSNNNYGPSQAPGVCPTSANTSMFYTDATMRIAISAANGAGGGPTRCATDGTNFAMSAKLNTSANHWCVDSTNASREIASSSWSGYVCP